MKISKLKLVSDDLSQSGIQPFEQPNNKKIFTPKEVKTMSEQFIAPHARVWDRIEETLNEQDKRREKADQIIKASFATNQPATSSRNLYFATVAGLSLVAGIVWKMI